MRMYAENVTRKYLKERNDCRTIRGFRKENIVDRLTARNERGKAYFPYCFRKDTCEGLGASEKCDTCELTQIVCERLAEYEELEQLERKE